MSKHTKGPWEYEGEDGNYGHVVGKPGQCTDIAYCQEEANARLIAAAPDLLEALEAICLMQARNYGDATQTHLDLPDLVVKARAVIAKARGES